MNDAPTLDAISNPAAINEDAGAQTESERDRAAGESQSLSVSASWATRR